MWAMSTMPLFTTIPNRTMRPIWDMMLKGVPVRKRNQVTPTRAKGSENMMAKGWARDSNREAITK